MTTATHARDEIMAAVPVPDGLEWQARGVAGLPALIAGLAVIIAGSALLALLAGHGAHGATRFLTVFLPGLLVVLAVAALKGLTAVAPGQAVVVQLFGRYRGTLRGPGLHWINPCAQRHTVSTRLRNHETAVAKVNDADGNPIEIAAVVVWQVEDTARALFEVDDFVAFTAIQAETAVRHIASCYPYDNRGDGPLSLRENAEVITAQLSDEIAARVRQAGVKVIESRLTRLSYAPEIAHAMLQRQQADAVVAARQRIVAGAVGMVELALARLAENGIVELDEERKAAMVSNLLVVLCSDRGTQPVINTGSLYQ